MQAQEIPLWEHQIKGIELGLKIPDLLLAFEMGCGKTRTAIEIMRRRFHNEKRVMRTLILCPPVVIENWRREILQFSKISAGSILPLKGTAKRRENFFRQKCLNQQTLLFDEPMIVITNYEAMQMKDLIELFHEWEPEILICDESHKCKSHESKRAKEVVKIADICKHRLLLTGTPILNSVADLFMQFRILDGYLQTRGEYATFGHNFWAFRAKYMEDENSGWTGKPGHFAKYVPREDTYAELSDKIFRKSLRVLKKECLDLPDLIKEKRFVEMGAEQARLYKEMRDEYLAYIDDLKKTDKPRAVVAQLAITKALRLQQIVSGFAKTDTEEIYVIKDNPRLLALTELLEELAPEHKVIVWAAFQENYRQIAEVCTRLAIPFAELHGKVANKRDEMIDTFRKDPKCRVMIANQQAGGLGVNLTEASYSIFYSKGFSLGDDRQAESRNHRGGSEIHEKITRIDLICADSIDELISEALANKENISQQVLDWREKL